MKRFAADLHIHTALSPCASKEMAPPAIVQAAGRRKIHMIAICDHNATANIAPVQEAAAGVIAVIAGIEITTAEEVHVLGLFPDVASADKVSQAVRASLPPNTNERLRKFGEQLLMDARGRVTGMEPKMLSAASAFTLAKAVRLIQDHGGLAVAAHVNRPSFSVISQLGMLPEDVLFDAVEVASAGVELNHKVAVSGLPIVASSDSHFLEEVSSCGTIFEIMEPTFEELAMALKGLAGRRCRRA